MVKESVFVAAAVPLASLQTLLRWQVCVLGYGTRVLGYGTWVLGYDTRDCCSITTGALDSPGETHSMTQHPGLKRCLAWMTKHNKQIAVMAAFVVGGGRRAAFLCIGLCH